MRDKKRIKRILKLIDKNWLEVPDQRLGQFLINYVYMNYTDIFYQEDDITEDNLLSIKKKEEV